MLKNIDIAIDEFRKAMADAGIVCNATIICDGTFHNFKPTGGKKESGWYILHDGKYGAFGDFAKGIRTKWRYGSTDKLSRYQQRKLNKTIKESYLKLEVDNKAKQDKAADKAASIFDSLPDEGSSEYLKRKQVDGHGIKYGKGYIVVPLRNVEGKLCSLQFIADDGSKRFLAGSKKIGCYHLIGDMEGEEQIFITEGYATAASIYRATQKPILVAFDAGNLGLVIHNVMKAFPRVEIVIAADDDCWKENNVGRTKAETAARKCDCQVVFPKFKDTSSKPTDFNDLHCLEGLEQVRRQLNCILNPLAMPSNFKLHSDGLYWFSYDEEVPPLKLCSAIEVSAFSHDEYDANHGLVLQWLSPRTLQKHRWAMPMRLLSGDGAEIRAKLLDEGLLLSPGRKAKEKFLEFLTTVEPSESVISISRIGWHNGSYILPDQVFPDSTKAVLQNDSAAFAALKTSGTLLQWQTHIAKYAADNTRFLFAIATSFAAPLLHIAREESGGVHFFGSSSTGKTTLLKGAASVWGGGTDNGYIQQWRATSNALEAIAENHRDALLVLDELGQADSKSVGDTIYMLANNQGKGRLKSSSELRKAYHWRLLFLSSGEMTLEAKMSEALKKPLAGMETRFANIPADAGKNMGVFEHLHEFDNAELLCRHLATATKQYYGTAIRTFLHEITTTLSSSLEHVIAIHRRDFSVQFLPDNADGQVKRVAGRFGLIAAAGEIAIECGILPLERGTAFIAAGRCFIDWLSERGTCEPMEIEKGIQQIKAFFELHASSRFAVMDRGDDMEESKIINQAGFKRKTADGVYEYFVYPEVFKNELCKGFSPKVLLPVLVERTLLIPDKHGKVIKNQWLPNIGSKKVYHFAAVVME